MKTRFLAVSISAAAMLGASGCTIPMGYRNAEQCKQKMIATYPSGDPDLTPLRFERSKIAYRGSRVVIEATFRVPKKVVTEQTLLKKSYWDVPAAVECTFQDEQMQTFRWLTPSKLAKLYEKHESEDE